MKRGSTRIKKWLIAGSLASASCLLLLIITFLLIRKFVLYGKYMPEPMDFQSALWKSTPATHDFTSIRIRMVDDLLESHPLVGLSRTEVEALLGPADKTPYFRNFDLVYMLGPERGFIAIDSEWLLIQLDPDGRVSQAILGTD